MSPYEIVSLILQTLIAMGAISFGLWQIFINRRLVKLQDFVALAIAPANGFVKLLNTGRVNVYLRAFEINGVTKVLPQERLIPTGALNASYYWFPSSLLPKKGTFTIKLYTRDEFGTKYSTEGGGESKSTNKEEFSFITWTHRTVRSNWTLQQK